MSLQDESFPADELFDQLNNVSGLGARSNLFSEHHQPAAFERDPAPFLEICYDNADGDGDGDADVANKSAKTCVSDPVGRDQEDEEDDDADEGCAVISNGRSNKAVSYQDIHSAYTKRRYRHVTSKVGQYIAEIQAQDQKRRSASRMGFQRHSSMPEYLTPKSRRTEGHFEVENELPKMDNSSHSYSNSSCSCERLLAKVESLQEDKESLQHDKEHLQAYNDYVQGCLNKKIADMLQMRHNFETLRTELSDCHQKLSRYQNHSVRSLNSWLPTGIERATQTDFSAATCPSATGNALALTTPHPHSMDNLSFNSTDGSIEMALLSVTPPVRIQQNPGRSKMAILPQSLDYSSVIIEADGSGNGEVRGDSSSRELARREPAPNNSESSQPSSNDSAIEVEGHEEERASSRRRGHQADSGGIYFFDKRNSRVVEVLRIKLSQNQSLDTSQNQSINDSQAHLLVQSMSSSHRQTHVHLRTKRTTLGSRMLRLLGPCVRCRNGDPNSSNATFTVGLPPMAEEEFIDPRNQG
ncbi:protein swallow [Drosophila rhopaloa]|uniref:Protein swallow n=1 Tax=Drosophila rhopaloa TaxID=1041015 RepID=A0A6P4FHR0_DRORH|nr:protein swallow [Drosophila rhopaloa]